jgi:hypothetical protein
LCQLPSDDNLWVSTHTQSSPFEMSTDNIRGMPKRNYCSIPKELTRNVRAHGEPVIFVIQRSDSLCILFPWIRSVTFANKSIFHGCPEGSPLRSRDTSGAIWIKVNFNHTSNSILGSRRDPPCPASSAIRSARPHIRSVERDSQAVNDSCAKAR